MTHTSRINPLTASEQAIIDEFEHLRSTLQWTDYRMWQRFVARPGKNGVSYSYSTWIRVRQNKYTGDTRAVVEHVAASLDELRRYAAADEAARPRQGAETFIMTPDAESVINALAIARANKGVKRLVMFIAPPGGGKSALSDYLRSTQGALIAYADESWRRSNAAGWLGIGSVLGVREYFRSTAYLQNAVLQRARELGRSLLIIEDANTFGPHTCNMVRDICNHTLMTLLLVGTAIPFSREGRTGYQEGEQMRRRSVAIIRARRISPDWIAPFFSWASMNGCASQALQAVADAAERYNKLDFVTSVSGALQAKYGARSLTLSDVIKQIDIEARKLQRAP